MNYCKNDSKNRVCEQMCVTYQTQEEVSVWCFSHCSPHNSCEFIWHSFTRSHSVSQLQFVDVKSAGGLFFSSRVAVAPTEGICCNTNRIKRNRTNKWKNLKEIYNIYIYTIYYIINRKLFAQNCMHALWLYCFALLCIYCSKLWSVTLDLCL